MGGFGDARKDVELSTLPPVSLPPLTNGNAHPTTPVPLRPSWPKTRRALLIISTLLLIALFAMHALEIARLAANHQGIGLLPFCFVPLLLVLISLYVPSTLWSRNGFKRPARPHSVIWCIAVSVWCICMSVTYGVKIWSVSRLHTAIGTQAYDGSESKYPYSDKIVSVSRLLISKVADCMA